MLPAAAAANDWKLAAPVEYAKVLLSANLRPADVDARSGSLSIASVSRGCFNGGGGVGSIVGSACAMVRRTAFACGVTASLVDRAASETAAAAAAGGDCHPLLAAGIVFNADLPPLCSPALRPGPPGDTAQALTMQVSDALAQSGCLDYAQLNIGRCHRLQLHVDAVCLSADGSLADACLLAVSAALRDLRLPRLVVSADEAAVSLGSGGREPLQLLRGGGSVLCTSFALAAAGSAESEPDAASAVRLLPAPTQLEEALPGVAVVRVVTAGGGQGSGDGASGIRVVSLQKMGGGPSATAELLARCSREAAVRHAAIMKEHLA